MKTYAAAVCVIALLASSMARGHPQPRIDIVVSSTDPVTRERTVRPAADAERAHIKGSLRGVEGSLATRQSLETSLAGLEQSLASLKGLDARLSRLQRMVDTETPVSTETTKEGMVRVYRDGTTVIDKGESRTFQLRD